ncbi:DNA-processing protein DprA [Sulfurospirillum sp. 1307]|jgi:DNA processing protein
MRVEFKIDELNSMQKYPQKLFYKGNLELLKLPKISVVGTRRPSNYTKKVVAQLCSTLSKRGVCIVSGGAMGVDAIAHKNSKDTICVLANGIDIRYPKVNTSLFEKIEKDGLLLSQFEEGFRATPWSFVVRNELVIALGEVVIIAEADKNSGSMRSAEFALKMEKEIYVLPHRLDESKGTNQLLKDGLAKAIFDMEEFANKFGDTISNSKDEVLEYIKENSSFEKVFSKYGNLIYEYELDGKIQIKNGHIYIFR